MLSNWKKGLPLVIAILAGGVFVFIVKWPGILGHTDRRQRESSPSPKPAAIQMNLPPPAANAIDPNPRRVPEVFPGDTVQNLKEKFGKESESTNGFYKSLTWDLPDCRLDVEEDNSAHLTSVAVHFKNVPLLTPQNVILGRDTLNDVKAKLGPRLIADLEDLTADEGLWFLFESLGPSDGKNWHTTYTWTLSEMVPRENEILGPWPHKPEAFANVPVVGYQISALPPQPKRPQAVVEE